MELPTCDNPVSLIEGDALAGLRALPDNSFDAVVTDPPFGVRADEWDDMDAREFARFSMAWMSEARRVSREAVIFCTADSALCDIAGMLYPRVRRMVWHKPIGSQYAGSSECGVWHAHETILHCYDPDAIGAGSDGRQAVAAAIREGRLHVGHTQGAVDIHMRGQKTGLCCRWEEGACLPTERQAVKLATFLSLGESFWVVLRQAYAERDAAPAVKAIDVFSYRTVTSGSHPCEKPLRLMRDILTSVGRDYRRILDPFAGSGTTLVAAACEGRQAMGFEQDPKYAVTARGRVENARGSGLLAGIA